MAQPLPQSRTMPHLAGVAPEIPVTSVEEASSWYEEILGFRTTMKMPDGDYAIVERDGASLHLFRGEAEAAVSLHIFVGGIEALVEELEARGAALSQRLIRQPWGTRDFRLLDPFGNMLKFTEIG